MHGAAEHRAEPRSRRHHHQVRLQGPAVQKRSLGVVGGHAPAADRAALALEPLRDPHHRAPRHQQPGLRLVDGVGDVPTAELGKAKADLVDVEPQVRHPEPAEGRQGRVLPGGPALPGQDQRAALLVEDTAELLLQLQPAQPCLPSPAGVELVAAVDGAQQPRVVGGSGAAVARLPRIHELHPAALAQKARGGHDPGDAGADHRNLGPIAHSSPCRHLRTLPRLRGVVLAKAGVHR